MANPLLDALGTVGHWADLPGAYTRGLLAGRPGERATGQELLSSYGLSHAGDPYGSLKGFATEAVLDPLSLIGPGMAVFKGIQGLTRGARALAHADDVNPLLKVAGHLVGHEEGALGLGQAPFRLPDVAAATGRNPAHLDPAEALAAYQPWVDQLLPEEAASVRLFTSGPQGKISHALRGASETSAGFSHNPFVDETTYGSVLPGTVPIKMPADVTGEVVPYLDSALSRSAAPKDQMTYRLAGQLGELRPGNVEEMLGRTVSDPSYLSTTIDPMGRFYGQSANPKELLLDMMVPKGGRGGYAQGLSRWEAEKELLLPRGTPFQVAAAQQIPVEKIDYNWHRLDPAGRPIPKTSVSGRDLFRDVPDDEVADFLERMKAGSVTEVPEEFLQPGWKAFRDAHLQKQGMQTNVLLEMLGGGRSPHLPAIRRRSPQESVDRILSQLGTPGERDRKWLARKIEWMQERAAAGEYPAPAVLEDARRAGILDPSVIEGLYRSFPRGA